MHLIYVVQPVVQLAMHNNSNHRDIVMTIFMNEQDQRLLLHIFLLDKYLYEYCQRDEFVAMASK